MLTLSRFVSKPALVYKRKPTNPINIQLVSCQKENSGNLLKFLVKSSSGPKSYEANVWLDSLNSINMNTKCKLSCTCPSFKFEFASILNKFDSVYGEVERENIPKKAKPIFCCKHLYGIIIYIIQNNNIDSLKRRIKTW